MKVLAHGGDDRAAALKPAWGFIRETRMGALSSAYGRRARFANAQALPAISDFRHAESRTAGA